MSSRPKSSARVVSALAALALLAGCTSNRYVVQVDAISQSGAVAQPAREAHSYKVRPHNPGNTEENLRYKEVSDYVKTALSGRGLYEAPSVESADLIIEIDYGMETPRMKYETVMTPIMGLQEGNLQQGIMVTSANTEAVVYRPVTATGSSSKKIIGWKEETEPVVVYEKYLKISARENREPVEGRVAPEVWSVNVSAEDESNELRKYMPILASATADYIGTNTKQEKSVAIGGNDESVKFIRKGM